jgi:hypothetical protein
MRAPISLKLSPGQPRRRLALLFAAIAGLIYLIIGFGLAPEGFESPPTAVMLLAGATYLLGGVLILVAERPLLAVGAAANVLVLALFTLSALRGTATLDALSLAGKAAQVVLGILLVWLILEDGRPANDSANSAAESH